MTPEQKAYQKIYGEEGKQGFDYIGKIKQNGAELIDIHFAIACGHDKVLEHAQKLVEKMQLYGINTEFCDKFLVAATNVQQRKDMRLEEKQDVITTIASAVIMSQHEKINIYTSAIAANLIKEGATALGFSSEKEFIKHLLGANEKDLSKIYGMRMMEQNANLSKLTFGEQMKAIQQAIERKNFINMQDIARNSLESGISKKDIIQAKQYEENKRNSKPEKGRETND